MHVAPLQGLSLLYLKFCVLFIEKLEIGFYTVVNDEIKPCNISKLPSLGHSFNLYKVIW